MWGRWTFAAGRQAVALVCFVQPVLAAGTSGAGTDLDTKLADLVSQAGLRAVEPATPSVEIALADIHGQRVHLSDFSGRWVLVTFLASWCGPCASEMPALSKLARARAEALTVLGVAIESNVDAVAAFAREHGANFPVLIDAEGKTAATYAASSIPLSYLIRPDGRIAGVARGARDWSGAAELIDTLSKLMPASREPSPGYAQADVIELPTKLTPPTAEVALAAHEITAGAPFAMSVRISWAGHLDDYLLLPPTAELPAGVTAGPVSAQSSSTSGQAVITYRFELTAAQAGTFNLGAIDLRYTPHGESGALSARVPGPTIEVHPARFLGLTAGAWVFSLSGTLAVASLTMLAQRWRGRRRERLAKTRASDAEQQQLADRLTSARAARMRGDVAGFVETLLRLHESLGETPPLELVEAVQATRYGGIAPSPHLLEAWERRSERLLAAQAPDADTQALRALGITGTERKDQ